MSYILVAMVVVVVLSCILQCVKTAHAIEIFPNKEVANLVCDFNVVLSLVKT